MCICAEQAPLPTKLSCSYGRSCVWGGKLVIISVLLAGWVVNLIMVSPSWVCSIQQLTDYLMGDGARLGLGDTARNRTFVPALGKAGIPSNSAEGSVEQMET